MAKFKKGELTEESFRVIMNDLHTLSLKKTKDNEYYFGLVVGNLEDVFGIKMSELKEEEDLEEEW